MTRAGQDDGPGRTTGHGGSAVTTAQELMTAQCSRLPALDSALPAGYPLPRDGEPIMARLSGGDTVAGLVTHAHHPTGSPQRLWSAADTYELFPLVGHRPQEGMDALLRAWREQFAGRDVPDDSSCVVAWPSRDVAATRALLDHGLVPLSCLAVRLPERPAAESEPSGRVTVRRAGPSDLEAVVELTLAELEYASLVGASALRPDAATLKRNAAHVRLNASGAAPRDRGGTGHGPDPVWLAERDGTPVAVAECGWVHAGSGLSGHRLTSGPWAYVNCLSVRESERGSGVGRQLMTVAHAEFARAGVVGSYLYYNPPNPLSSVFWARQGYRPLWTMWEIRPANALR